MATTSKKFWILLSIKKSNIEINKGGSEDVINSQRSKLRNNNNKEGWIK